MTTRFTSFALPVDPQYYNHAACANIGNTVRFYDDKDINGLHGNAICSDDCIKKHKNAILQSPNFNRFLFYPAQKGAFGGDCNDLSQPNLYSLIGGPGSTGLNQIYGQCYQGMRYLNFLTTADRNAVLTLCRYSNVELSARIYEQFSSYAKKKLPVLLFDISGNPNGNELTGPDLYNPSSGPQYSGSLIDKQNQTIIDSLATFGTNFSYSDGSFGNINLVGDIFNFCLTFDTNIEQANINYCRSSYTDAYSTTFVGNPNPLNVVPDTRDKLSSMGLGCLYVIELDCPPVQTLCKSDQLKGTWEFGLGDPTKMTNATLYGRHFCRNYNQADYNPNFNPFLDSAANPYTNQELISAYDPRLINSTPEPAAFANYIYRSCDLVKFGNDTDSTIGGNSDINCCANDFADLNGSSVFIPGVALPPKNRGALNSQPLDIDIPLLFFNFDYEHGGTGEQYGTVPYYNRCFTKNGFTCPVESRDITIGKCPGLMLEHCFGDPVAGTSNTSLPESWVLNSKGTGECSKWIGRAIYGGNNQWLEFIDIVNTRDFLKSYIGTNMLSSYLTTIIQQIPTMLTMDDIALAPDGVIVDPLRRAVEPIFFALYKSYNLSLYDDGWLAQQCSQYSVDQITKNTLLRQWCGCLLNPDIYSTRYPGISSECTPFCNSSDVIQVGQQCTGSSCIIDDITINIINSTTGNISISQFCNACSSNDQSDNQTISQKCNCTLGEGIDITIIQSKVGNIDLSQLCNMSNSGSDPNPNPLPNPTVNSSSNNPFQEIPPSILAITTILFIMIIIFYNRPALRNGLILTFIISLLALGVFYYFGYSNQKTV